MGRFNSLKEKQIPLGEDVQADADAGAMAVEPAQAAAPDADVAPVTVSRAKAAAAAPFSPPPRPKRESKKSSPIMVEQPRRVGRPSGRRSNPDYTQICAYIPLDLLLSIQDVLAEERRALRQRTARPVSDLVEELLAKWLKQQKAK
jgi:hypothetical protein